MNARVKNKGFTLVEIMVVVTIIGILATLAVPAYKRVNLRARGAAFINDGRVFGEAFQRYAQEHGEFPLNRPKQDSFPLAMTNYISREKWVRETPIGGRYSWDNYRGSRNSGHRGAVMVTKGKFKMADMRLIDAWFDDGDTTAGVLQVRAAGSTVYYMLEN